MERTPKGDGVAVSDYRELRVCQSPDQQGDLAGRYDHIRKQLQLMMRDADRWAPVRPSARRSQISHRNSPPSTLSHSTEQE